MSHVMPLGLRRLATRWVACLALAAALSAGTASAQSTVVFSTDFETGLPPEFSAPGAQLAGVQGFAGLGHGSDTFGGSFLRYDVQAIQDTRLTVRDLPPHDHLSVGFLLGVIDSWDGVELLQMRVDDALLFSHWFQLALGDSSDYLAPPGGVLSRGVELGFSLGSYYHRDRAYDMSLEPAFQDIPHTADSVVVRWSLDAVPGGGANYWQGGADESWAIDHVRVSVRSSTTDAVGTATGGLALSAPTPNPARGNALRVRLALASDAPARLTMHDLQGRLVRAVDWAAPAAGARVADLSSGERLAPGVYFLRLAQGGAQRTTRVVISD